MKSVSFLFLALISAAIPALLHASPPRGNVLELHSCEVYAGGCKVSSEATQDGRYLVQAWRFTGGTFDGSDLAGLRLAVLKIASENLASPETRANESVVYLPEDASASQRQALLAWLRSTSPDLGKVQERIVPLQFDVAGAAYRFSAGSFVSLDTTSLERCTFNSCGEALWYQPRSATDAFTVAVNRSAQINEPLLKLKWSDALQRSVFLGRFGEGSGKEI